MIIRFAVSEPQDMRYQLAPGHGINSPPWQAPRVMPVSTRSRSWYQLAPGQGINSPRIMVSTRPKPNSLYDTIGFFAKSCGEWQIVQKYAMNNELCDDICGIQKIV